MPEEGRKLEVKILYVISTLGGGGAESQLCTYALELKKTHPEIQFHICAVKAGGVFEKKLSDSGIEFTVLNSGSLLRSIRKVRKMIRKERYDIVHAHMFRSDIIARMATIGCKTKVVATHHGLGKWKTRPMLWVDRLTKHRVDQFIMVSQQSYDLRLRREKYPASRMTVVYNGLSDRFLSQRSKELPQDGKSVVIGTIARMTDNKQINLMIDVMKDLEGYPNLRYEVIGDGENYDKLVQQIKELRLESRVCLLGWQDDVLKVIRHWHIFALPSVNEDLPVAMMECMAQGIVPVASKVGGVITLLDNGKNGILCDSGNRKTFADAIEFLMSHPGKYAEFSANCRRIIQERYMIQKTVNDTVAIYMRLREKI